LNTNNPTGTTPSPTSETVSSNQSRLISKVLSPAVKLWLRSQVQQVSHLEVEISGSDHQILHGTIPRISIVARNAVYKRLHLTQIQLVGEGIRTNLGQVLRGQPLRLLEPVPVFASLLLQESDLNTSLESPLLTNALTELLLTLLPSSCLVDGQVRWHKIGIDSGCLIMSATTADTSTPTPVVIRTGLKLANCHELQLKQPQIQTSVGLPLVNLDDFKLDLGPEVAIEELTLSAGQLACRGRINVVPATSP
jgi:hypothetical protein